MTRQVPRGPDDMECPLRKRTMSAVCHKCPLWTQVRGKHPQTGEDVDEWNCAVALLPMLLVENAKNTSTLQSAMESTRNETTKLLAEGILREELHHRDVMKLHGASASAPEQIANGQQDADPRQIELISED